MRSSIFLWAALTATIPSIAFAQATSERLTEAVRIEGTVFVDRNGDGRQNTGEPGVSGVAVSDQVQVVTTDEMGRFVMDARGYGLVFVSQPDGYSVTGPFWRTADGSAIEFALTPLPSVSSFTFLPLDPIPGAR